MNGTRRSTRITTDPTTQDENARPTTRLTRARSAQPLQAKTMRAAHGQPVVEKAVAGGGRKRAAMADVSNRHASTVVPAAAGKPVKTVVKPVAGTSTGLRSKQEAAPAKTSLTTSASLVEKRKATRLSKQPSVREEEPPLKRGKSESAPSSAAAVPSTATIHDKEFAQATSSTLPPLAASEPITYPVSPPPKPQQQDWEDLDAGDAEDPLMVSEYVVEIFNYLREQEIRLMPRSDYMEMQPDLAWKMRGILIDWLIEVHQKFRLLPETLFLTVNLLDRFLSAKTCVLAKLQLVGITALFVASKYEEVMCPSVSNFIYMADGGYKDDEILQAEQYLLKTLDFDLAAPNPMNFLRRISKADQYDIQVRTVAKYLLEVAAVDHRFLVFPPSLVCGAAMWLSRRMLDRGVWDANLVHYSGYKERQLIGCVQMLMDYLRKPVRHEALFKKYASKKFIKASLFVRDWCGRSVHAEPILSMMPDDDYMLQDDADV